MDSTVNVAARRSYLTQLRERDVYASKRVLDVVLATIALILLAPVMIVVAALVRLTSKGPALFRQTRVGKDGKTFTIYKFRTMAHAADDAAHRDYITAYIRGEQDVAKTDGNGNGVFKMVEDSRVTPIGRWLRKTSLDELPQLLNVLKGDMSLVGPRPHIEYEVELYSPWHRRRLNGVPGLTGWWQVTGRSAVTFDESVRMDIWYLEHQSLYLDLRILGKTFGCVFRGKGAY